MSFTENGKTIELKGQVTFPSQLCDKKQIIQSFNKGKQGLLMNLQVLNNGSLKQQLTHVAVIAVVVASVPFLLFPTIHCKVASLASKARFGSSGIQQMGGRLGWSRNYAAKDIRFGVDARALMLKSVEEFADAGRVTMRLKGWNVMIEQSFGAPKVTKYGVTVAKSIEFKDRVKNMGTSLMKKVANAINDVAGEGTTCATIFIHTIFANGCKFVTAGMNAMDLRSGVTIAIDAVVTNLKSQTRMITSIEEIAPVGTISSNGERKIGELIAKAMEKAGKGVITIADSKTLYNELEVVEGMKLDRGYIFPYFSKNPKTQKCELEDPLILVHENKIFNINAVVKMLELALKRQIPLLIVAEDVESDALATLILNKLRVGIKVCCIKAPGFAENRKANRQDLATLTDKLGMNLEKVDWDVLGTAKTSENRYCMELISLSQFYGPFQIIQCIGQVAYKL